jgi:hypothetical protein
LFSDGIGSEKMKTFEFFNEVVLWTPGAQ